MWFLTDHEKRSRFSIRLVFLFFSFIQFYTFFVCCTCVIFVIRPRPFIRVITRACTYSTHVFRSFFVISLRLKNKFLCDRPYVSLAPPTPQIVIHPEPTKVWKKHPSGFTVNQTRYNHGPHALPRYDVRSACRPDPSPLITGPGIDLWRQRTRVRWPNRPWPMRPKPSVVIGSRVRC